MTHNDKKNGAVRSVHGVYNLVKQLSRVITQERQKDPPKPYREIAEMLGLESNCAPLVQRLETGKVQWSPGLLRRLTGQQYTTIALHVPVVDGEALPGSVCLDRNPLRQCPVTGDWFVAPSGGERYRPDLSAAVRREARRDLDNARRKYAELGDWGKSDDE